MQAPRFLSGITIRMYTVDTILKDCHINPYHNVGVYRQMKKARLVNRSYIYFAFLLLKCSCFKYIQAIYKSPLFHFFTPIRCSFGPPQSDAPIALIDTLSRIGIQLCLQLAKSVLFTTHPDKNDGRYHLSKSHLSQVYYFPLFL